MRAKTLLYDEIRLLRPDEETEAKVNMPEVEDPRVQKFTVTDPIKASGHFKYTITGVDQEGEFSQVRRFNEFFALAEILRVRWPGCYVPSIPEKKYMNSSNEEYVEERRILLERFMKEIAKYDHIVFSKEF